MGLLFLAQPTRYFPQFGLAEMQEKHGSRWADLVAWVTHLPGSDPHVMALTRTLRQLSRHDAHAGSKHDPFCTICAREVLARFSGSEDDLLGMYHRNLNEINDTLANMRLHDRTSRPDVAIA